MQSYEGIYENGVVRFPSPVTLPEHTKVTVIAPAQPESIGSSSDEIYDILERRYNSGHTDTAARVDELNP